MPKPQFRKTNSREQEAPEVSAVRPPEKPEIREKKPEAEAPEKLPVKKEEEAAPPGRPGKVPAAPAKPVPAKKSPARQQIEEILQEDIREIYQTMNADEQKRFRQKGIEVSEKIEELVVSFKAKAGRILNLIKSWLFLIPRANKFYLEQESKKKTEEIMKLAAEVRNREKHKA